MRTSRTRNIRGVLIVAMLLAAGCAAGRSPRSDTAGGAAAAPAADAGDLLSGVDRQRLEVLTTERSRGRGGDGYLIGPDDLLQIRIPDLLDVATDTGSARDAGVLPVVAQAPVASQGVRVSGDGHITLPILGAVPAAGLTPRALEHDIARRLVDGGILRRPQVSVQIAEYRSHVVAVVGSVQRPGLYPVTRPGATLADLIWAAGGPNRDAGRIVEFVPAQPNGAGPSAAAKAPSSPEQAVQTGNPVRLDLQMLLQPTAADARLLNPPVRPGDVISLAPAGTVQVDGWVQKPGSYPLTRGLTLTGAVAAAGGKLFPADRREISVKRTLGSGEARHLTVDVDAVGRGDAPDLPMIDGDVVRVPASYARLAPWAVWSAVRELVRVGGSVLLF